MRGAGIVWAVVAFGAALMGLLLISDEPGATAGRWYLAFAVAAAVLTVGAFRGPANRTWVLVGSILLMAGIAIHYFVVVDFSYAGLTLLLLVPAALAVVLAVLDWLRNRSSKRPVS
jgi:uncharacterized membrane protein